MADKLRETATTVYKAFRALNPNERGEVLERIVKDQQLREDLLDLATFEARRHEKGRSLREYLASRKEK